VDCGNWTCTYVAVGPVGASFVNITPSATQAVSAGGTITFTLNFVTPQPVALDHFKCYWIENEVFLGDYVYLEDQFLALEAEVDWAYYFCNPVEKTYDGEVTEIKNRDHHLTIYDLYYEEDPQMWSVQVDNQFGTQQLTVWGPTGIAVPTQKLEPGSHEPPVGLDHFLLYEVLEGPDVNVYVGLDDQFGDQPEVYVYDPIIFANPVRKTDAAGMVTEIVKPDEHLVFYYISGDPVNYPQVQVSNQFGEQAFAVYDPEFLAVPSGKTEFEKIEPTLDHFMCYWVGEDMVLPEWPGVVYLEDQLCAVEAEVGSPWGFFNPVEKWHDGVPTPISNPDHHLLAYDIYYEEGPQWWQVEVNNQFGVQTLIVYGPVALAVPTQKIEPMYHEPPVGLDHFMLYEVIEGPQVNVVVGLNDQFGDQPEVEVSYPDYFFIPVKKTDGNGIVTEIQNPDEHLVSYEIWGELFYQQVQVVNQFGEHIFPNVEGPYCLTVPSEKLSAGQLPPQQ
jgi:hypothetical protein